MLGFREKAEDKLVEWKVEADGDTSDVTATAKYDAPKLAVEEVAAVNFENGVIYSSSIVVYNVAGQVIK